MDTMSHGEGSRNGSGNESKSQPPVQHTELRTVIDEVLAFDKWRAGLLPFEQIRVVAALAKLCTASVSEPSDLGFESARINLHNDVK
jgi:hypothetical protein